MYSIIKSKLLLIILVLIVALFGCTSRDIEEGVFYEAPLVRSYVTYISKNTATINGFIDYSNRFFPNEDWYQTGFILRENDASDATNDQIINIEGDVPYFSGIYAFDYKLEGLQPNTTYYYSATTKNGSDEKENWRSFTTSDIACNVNQDNYYSISDVWKDAYVEVESNCCNEGNIGFRFGTWPAIFEISFNELDNGYPQTGQYFGVEYGFNTTYTEKDLVKSSNQVLIENNLSTTETTLFVENDGETISLIFCDAVLRDGTILNVKVSTTIL